ncbi:hypothetical protein [Glutamicibacter uratoxydans]|uniref:hypothetical protein n=1 Tax=Glutamicibacter uratoxydans TaxID=43667 RepID=UPI001476F798|nr:hypothetical protein [Glutamicibacter uratoxydans]
MKNIWFFAPLLAGSRKFAIKKQKQREEVENFQILVEFIEIRSPKGEIGAATKK